MRSKLPKKKKITAIKKTAWGWFSKYIRLRDCLGTMKSRDCCICVTCGVITDWNDLHAGHAIGGRNNSILCNERLVNGQCKWCNMPSYMGGKDGNYGQYHLWYIHKYGLEDFEEMVKLSDVSVQMTYEDWKAISDKYRKMYRELDSQVVVDKLKIEDIL